MHKYVVRNEGYMKETLIVELETYSEVIILSLLDV